MSLPLDHVVIAVNDLAKAMDDYRQLGFQVLPGGKHPGRESSNALIVFTDGTYIELIAWGAPNEERWYKTLQASGEGLVDFALLPSDTMAVLSQAQSRGLTSLHGPVDGGRIRPDGQWLRWSSARSTTADLPFLCGDITPRALRVPEAPELCKHANGALGVAGVTLLVQDIARSVARYRALLGEEAVSYVLYEEAHGAAAHEATRNEATVHLNGATVWLLQPSPQEHPYESARLTQRGEGPCRLQLRHLLKKPPSLNAELAHGAMISWR